MAIPSEKFKQILMDVLFEDLRFYVAILFLQDYPLPKEHSN